MTNTPQAPRRPQQPQRSSATNDLNRIEAASAPWWTTAPSVAMNCVAVAVAPFNLLSRLASTAVDLCFLAVVGAIALWWTGYIPQETVVALLGEAGTRILGILEGAGLL
jgi:hypothetical protein